MFKKVVIMAVMVSTILLLGCASVPMASKQEDTALKQFTSPPKEKAGLYIYRDTFVGQALKKNISLDSKIIGETANKVYFYKEVTPGKHELSTESEFSDNSISFEADGGKNYFVEQYIKMGVFVGGANLKMVDEIEGKKAVQECELAQQQ